MQAVDRTALDGIDVGADADPRITRRWSPVRGMGWRLRLLVAAALLGCLGLFALARWLADAPQVDALWRADAQGRLVLAETGDPSLLAHVGQPVLGIASDHVPYTAVTALDVLRTPRNVPADEARRHLIVVKQRLASAAADTGFRLVFEGGVAARPNRSSAGLRDLGATFWLLVGIALLLYLAAMTVVLADPAAYSLLYVVMAISESANLCLNAVDAASTLSLAPPFLANALPLRAGLGLVTLAAVVHAASGFPTRVRHARWLALAGWVAAATCIWGTVAAPFGRPWWVAQIGIVWLMLLAIGALTIGLRAERHPYALAMRRQLIGALTLWLAWTTLVSAPGLSAAMQLELAAFGTTGWNLVIAGMLIFAPFLARSPQVVREFSLLAAVSTVATALDLTFAAVWAMGPFTSLALSLFLSLAVYSGVRQWVLDRLRGQRVLSTERLFEQLYKVARQAESGPLRTSALLAGLLRELFDPMEVESIARSVGHASIGGAGSILLVPLPQLPLSLRSAGAPPEAILLRYAQRGRRLFSVDDARLCDRVVEQIERAIAFSMAVEQGRTEERVRLAQDLHDDIGSRLLTLMYQAQTPEIEDYLRHTLQDMKTLTRGLAASQHRLADAAADWRTDLVQRTEAARITLVWECTHDDNLALNVVQWSALTRILRELVSNAIAHAKPGTITVRLLLQNSRLDLLVADDGDGSDPAGWAHGLGLSGVRKRAKQLGGEVDWLRLHPQGIQCRLVVREFGIQSPVE